MQHKLRKNIFNTKTKNVQLIFKLFNKVNILTRGENMT